MCSSLPNQSLVHLDKTDQLGQSDRCTVLVNVNTVCMGCYHVFYSLLIFLYGKSIYVQETLSCVQKNLRNKYE